MEKIETERSKILEKIENLEGGAQDQKIAGITAYHRFCQGLKTGLDESTLTKSPELCRRLVQQFIHKVEILPDSYRIHYYVSEEHIQRQIEINGSSEPIKLRRAECENSLEKKCSSTLTNGGGAGN